MVLSYSPTAGRKVRASELLEMVTAINASTDAVDRLGEAGTPVHGATSTAFTTTEVASSTITYTFVAGRKMYLATSFSFGSSVAADVAQFRFRYRAGASIGTVSTATQAHISTVKAVAASTGYPVSFLAPLPSLSGQYTVALTAIRSSGSGNLQIDGTSDGTDRSFILLDMGV